MWKILLSLAGIAGVWSGAAFGQTLNMDMSWGFRSQANLWNQGQAAALAAARACYNYSLQLRTQGYTGPINCGANQQSLQNSIYALNQAQQNYIQGQTYNAQRRENAVNNWDMGRSGAAIGA